MKAVQLGLLLQIASIATIIALHSIWLKFAIPVHKVTFYLKIKKNINFKIT